MIYRKKKKFIPPREISQFYEKEEIREDILRIEEFPLTLITGRVGVGKTSSLVYYLHNYITTDYCWYNIPEEGIDLFSFWKDFISACSREEVLEEEMKKILNRFEQGEFKIHHFLEKIVGEIWRREDREFHFVIDEFHFLNRNPDIISSLETLIELLPPHFHMIISSRELINFEKLPVWKIKNKSLHIRDNDFLFSKRQIKDLFQGICDYLLTDREIGIIYEISGGWFPAINLIIELINDGQKIENIYYNREYFNQAIFTYLDQELWERQIKRKSEVRDFVLKTSTMRYIEPEVCNHLFDDKNWKEAITYLTNNSVFFDNFDDNKYQYQSLFRDYLYQKTQNETDIELIQNKIFSIYNKLNKKKEMIFHCLQIDKLEIIVRRLEKKEDNWFSSEEDYNFLKQAVKLLPEHIYERYPVLYLYKGDLFTCKGEYEEAIKSYNKAGKLLESNVTYYINYLIKMTMINFFLLSRKGIDYLQELKNYKDYFNCKQQKYFNCLETYYLLYKGQIELLEEDICKNPIFFNSINNLNTAISFTKGELNEVKEKLKNRRLIQDNNLPNKNSFTNYNILYLSLIIYLITGEVYSLLEDVWSINYREDNLSILFIEFCLLTTQQMLGTLDIETIRTRYYQLLNKERELGLDISYHRKEINLHQLLIEAYYGNIKETNKFYAETLKLISPEDYWSEADIYFGLGVCYYINQESQMAEGYFKKAKRIYKREPNKFLDCMIELWLALVSLHQGQLEEFKKRIIKTLSMAKNNNYDYIFLKPSFYGYRRDNYFIQLLVKARNEGIEPKYCSRLLMKLGLEGIDRHPGYRLQIKTLGKFEVYRQGKEITARRWKRKKARGLFKLMVTNYGRYVSRVKIISHLWPNKDEDSAKNTFDVTLSYLNKLLEPERNRGEDPFFIIRKGNKYGLRLTDSINIDKNVFMDFCERGLASKNINIKKRYFELAVKQFQGQFLPDIYDKWVMLERRQLKDLFLKVSEKLLGIYHQQGEYEKCIELGDKILIYDPCAEETYLNMMRSYMALGKKAAAAKCYLKCEEILEKKLNITPSERLIKYYQNKIVNDF